MTDVPERVKAVLVRHPDATPDAVAGALAREGISPEQVHEVFAEAHESVKEQASVGDDSPLADNRTLPSDDRFYPPTLVGRKWWVNWVLAYRHDEIGNGAAKPTKQPVAPYETGDADPVLWNAGLDDDEHPATDHSTVERWDGLCVGRDVPAPDRVISDEIGVGIIIPVEQPAGKLVLLIDWDDVRDPETGETHPVCVKALRDAGGWAEISQSGKGIHQFVFGEIPGGRRKFLRHVDDDREAGLEFLESWASERNLDEANLRVESGDVSTAIADAAKDCTTVIIGATGRGLLSRLLHGSKVVEAAEDVDRTVLLAERPTDRSLRERLFGWR